MIPKWIINIRCTCEEEYNALQTIHKQYRELKRLNGLAKYGSVKRG